MPRPTSLPTSVSLRICSWPRIVQYIAPGRPATMSPAWPEFRPDAPAGNAPAVIVDPQVGLEASAVRLADDCLVAHEREQQQRANVPVRDRASLQEHVDAVAAVARAADIDHFRADAVLAVPVEHLRVRRVAAGPDHDGLRAEPDTLPVRVGGEDACDLAALHQDALGRGGEE